MTHADQAERRQGSEQSEANHDNVFNKIAREAYVFGAGTIGGAFLEARNDVVTQPGKTALKVAETVGVGAAFAAAEFAPAPIKLGARVLGTGLAVHFFSDLVDARRWQGLGSVWSDTWNSGANNDDNFAKVQGSIGRLALETGVMIAGAKLGGAGIGKAMDFKFGPAKGMAEPQGLTSDGRYLLVAENSGKVVDIPTAKASPKEVAELVLNGGLAAMISHDAAAFNVARSAAIERGGLFSKSTPAQEAAIGSEAYIAGKPGNAYTAFLKDRFGTLSDMGLRHPVTEVAGAAAANPHVMELPVLQRKAAVEAVSNYALELARLQHPHADASALNVAVGKIAPTLTKAEVRAATDMHALNFGRVSPADVQSAARVHTATIGNEGYSAWRAARDAFAEMKTGNTGKAAALAEQLVPELLARGFRHEQMIRPDIMRVAAETFLKDPRLLSAAAISARILPRATTTESVGTIQAMLEAGWNGNAITRTAMKTARELIRAGA